MEECTVRSVLPTAFGPRPRPCFITWLSRLQRLQILNSPVGRSCLVCGLGAMGHPSLVGHRDQMHPLHLRGHDSVWDSQHLSSKAYLRLSFEELSLQQELVLVKPCRGWCRVSERPCFTRGSRPQPSQYKSTALGTCYEYSGTQESHDADIEQHEDQSRPQTC